MRTIRDVTVQAKSTFESWTAGWSHTGAMVVGRRVIFAAAECGKLYCLNLSDGETLWERDREDSLYVAGCVNGLVVLVGRNGARALRMESGGEQAWKVEDTLPGETSGVGYLSGGRYFLPLDSGYVAAIDVTNGQVEKLLHSRKGAPLGNLVCYDGAVFSRTSRGLQRFDQREALERQVAAHGGNLKNDPAALAIRGELALNNGKLSKAVRLLRRAYRAQPAERTRSALVDALLEGLRRDFLSYAGSVGKARSLIRGRAESAEFLILLAEALEKANLRPGAFAAWVEYADLELAEEQTRSVSPALSVRRDHWARARIEALLADATAPERAKMREIAANRLAAAKDDPAALRGFLHYFAHDELADQARSRLAQHADGELTLPREFMLRRLARADDPSLAVVGADKLASRYARSGRDALARWYVGQLATRWARAVSPDGKSGAQLAAERAADADFSRPPSTWPLGDVEATIETGPRVWSNMYPIRIERNNSPDAGRIDLTMEPQSCKIHGYGGLGQRLFAIEWPERISNIYSSDYLHRAWISGSLVVVSTGVQLLGIDVPSSEAAAGAKIIWRRNLVESESGNVRHNFSSRFSRQPWGTRIVEPFTTKPYQLDKVEMLGDDMMILANGGAVDGAGRADRRYRLDSPTRYQRCHAVRRRPPSICCWPQRT